MSSTAHLSDARCFLQRRLALMHRVGFALCFAFLLGVVVVRGAIGGDITSELSSPSRWFHILATLLTGGFWLVLRGRPLTLRTLEAVDAVGIVALSVLLHFNGALFPIRTVAVFNLALTTGTAAVLRAVVVPSTALRTFTLSVITGAFAVIVFFVSALYPGWPVHQTGPADWPLPFQLISLVLWLGSLLATATLASRVIFGLRREVTEARKLGQYTLGAKIGEGGMGIVYRATHGMLRRETALKLLPPDRIDAQSVRRFEREVVATALLRHPNTVAIFDYGRTPEGVFYYAMEYLDGLTIDELVEHEGPLPPGRVIWLLSQVCASLDEAHHLGLVHRDIKPANIMVIGHTAAYDHVKVLDFGLVKTLAPVPDGSLSQADELTGTPLYMAPELISSPDGAEPRSDLYAVAAVGYYMLTGKHVFEGRTVIEVCADHLHTPPMPVHQRLGRAVPAALEAIIMQGLSKAPTDRPASAAAMREALARCDVAPWGQAEARAWWQANGDASRRGADDALDPASARTLEVTRLPPA
ncbi:MAG: serine/threonine protein kinase [Polyangiaceae bacterium]|nr:serine/threonine protein kinase [Polyangiaceae bacterium]